MVQGTTGAELPYQGFELRRRLMSKTAILSHQVKGRRNPAFFFISPAPQKGSRRRLYIARLSHEK
jgi:hypothetical protein